MGCIDTSGTAVDTFIGWHWSIDKRMMLLEEPHEIFGAFEPWHFATDELGAAESISVSYFTDPLFYQAGHLGNSWGDSRLNSFFARPICYLAPTSVPRGIIIVATPEAASGGWELFLPNQATDDTGYLVEDVSVWITPVSYYTGLIVGTTLSLQSYIVTALGDTPELIGFPFTVTTVA